MSVIIGQGVIDGRPVTSFLVYLYITNLRNHSVHILDYDMEIELKEGFRKLKRGYGTMPPSKFLNRDRKEIIIPDLQEKLIYKNHEAVGFGQIYSGYIFFAGEPELYGKEIKRLRVTCVDALGKKHQFSSPPQFNLNLVAEMAGMVVPE